jgi:hypothetical protein
MAVGLHSAYHFLLPNPEGARRAINRAVRVIDTWKSIVLRSQKELGASFDPRLIIGKIECYSPTSGDHLCNLQFRANCWDVLQQHAEKPNDAQTLCTCHL